MLEDLSVREREIFDLLVQRVSPKEIARRLNISYSTVNFHRTNLYNKLGVHNIKEFLDKYSTNGKAVPEFPESKTITPVSGSKKHKRYKLLLSVGIALGIIMLAFSVLFIWILPQDKKPSVVVAPTPTETTIPIQNMGFYPQSDVDIGGNSTSEVYVTREEIDGVTVNVLNLKTNLARRENSDAVYANAHTEQGDIIQLFRQADGIRFKARGDGKLWNVEFHTLQTTPEGNYVFYIYLLRTVRDQVIDVDIPYSSLFQPEWYTKHRYDFDNEKIRGLSITANTMQGYGSSLLQIFDFETY